MAAIGPGWVDGAWIEASWVPEAWTPGAPAGGMARMIFLTGEMASAILVVGVATRTLFLAGKVE